MSENTGMIVGSTRYHDIVMQVDRLEIGHTWYAARWQRRVTIDYC